MAEVVDIFPKLADLNALSPGIGFAKYAPPEGLWYHGQLDRSRAEARLREAGQVGSYLVRRSEHQPATYVLSLLTGKGCLHVDIEVMYGKLYFAGDKFDSLVDLVGYFTKFCNIHEADHLRLPVAPPETANDKHRVVAILANSQRRIRKYTHLTFRRGDIFTVHNDMGGGLLWVTDFRSGEQGLIYRGFVEDLDGSIDPNVVHPWFHEVVPAYTKFLEAGPNSFVVVPSKEQSGDYLVRILIDHRIREVPIRFRDAAYAIGERDREFAILSDLIDYYRHAHIWEGHSLGEPVQRYSQPHLREPLLPEVAVRRIHQSSERCFDLFLTMLYRNTKSLGKLEMRRKGSDNWISVICESRRDLLFFGEQYNMPQELQPKGRIDLSRASLYECHNSLWNRSHCWLLVESLEGKRKESYFCAGSQECYDMCIAHLRPLCTFQLRNAQMDVPQSRHGAYLSVRVMKLLSDHEEAPTQRVYLKLALDQAVVARSEVQLLANVDWNIEFEFDNVPSDVKALQIQVMREDLEDEMCSAEIVLSKLDYDREQDHCYDLKCRNSLKYGQMQLRTYYLNDFIMPIEAYAPLQQILVGDDFLVLNVLSGVSEPKDHLRLAQLLLNVYARENCVRTVLIYLCVVSLVDEGQTIFNEGTLEDMIVKLFMRRECSDYAKALLTETVQRIIAIVVAADGSEDLTLQSLDWIAKDIFENERDITCPTSVTYIWSCVEFPATKNWNMDRAKRINFISQFIFRFVFCAALEDPQGFGLIEKRPSPQASRHLNRLSECFRQLATLQEFDSDRHPDMVGFNPFIREHKQSVIDLRDQFEYDFAKELEPMKTDGLTLSCARDLNSIHYFCELHLLDLQERQNSHWQQTLIRVTKELSEKKSQYREAHLSQRSRTLSCTNT